MSAGRWETGEQPVDVAPSAQYEPAAISLYAGWGRRFAAWLIDGVLLWLLPTLGALVGLHAGLGLYPLGALAAAAYFTVCHGGLQGQTLGKRIVGITVRDAESLGRIGYPRAFARWLVTLLFWMFFLVVGVLDGLAPLWDRNRRAWHDRVVRSVVVRL
jgi:uncharacterized RDD family membrane protein YckC